jgi:hypothetical protein
MAERHPFYFNGSSTSFSLRKMTDTNLASLRYQLRVAYAAVLNANGNGRLYTGGSNNVGQAHSTEYTYAQNQQNRNWNTGDGEDWPGYPGLGSTTRSTTTFTQTRSNVGFPSDANLRDYGWLYWQGSTTSFNMRVISAEQDFVDTLLTDTIQEAYNGDEVGTYRISTGSPGGGWTSKGGVFTNTIYSNNSQTTWNLYLKTSASDPAGENPVGYNGGFKRRDRSSGGSLVQTLLLPMLHRRVANNGALNYSINGTGTGRGTMTDTRYNSSSTNQWFTSNIYYRSRTPSGGQSNNANYELKVRTS